MVARSTGWTESIKARSRPEASPGRTSRSKALSAAALLLERTRPQDGPSDYWITNLPADSEPERLARRRWKIELDYKQLKGELGLDHYEGRSWLGWHHHTALVSVAHGVLTRERLCPRAPRPT